MNKFIINGRMCGEVDVRKTNTDKTVGNFSIAVQRKFDRDKTDFFRCTAWEKNAENIQKFFSKADMINIIGRIEIEPGEKDGVKVNYTNMIVEEWNFCGSKKQSDSAATSMNDNPFPDDEEEDELPFS